MSHVVTIQTRVYDHAAIAAVCERLGLPQPVAGTAQLYSGQVEGLIIHLSGWAYPAVIDTASGIIRYDNFGGTWGSQEHLDRFLQLYAVEMTKLEARKKGYAVTEQALSDGSIKLQILEGGA